MNKRIPGGADRFVRFLGLGALCFKVASLGAEVLCSVELLDLGASCHRPLLTEGGTVSSHIRNKSAFIEALSDPHRLGGTDPQLPCCILLKGTGGKGNRKASNEGLALDRRNNERFLFQFLHDRLCFLFSKVKRPLLSDIHSGCGIKIF